MPSTFTFRVNAIRELSEDISQVFLDVQSREFHYQSGQYIHFLLDNEEPRPYSIANASGSQMIEFHIRHEKNNVYAQKLIAQLHQNHCISLTQAEGHMRVVTTPRYPLLFVATGTGFAPCKALIEEALKDKTPPPLTLFWGARFQKDLYFHQELIALQQAHSEFSYIPVIGERVYEAVLKKISAFSQFHIYACGHEQMVLSAQKLFSHPPYFYSDWLQSSTKN